MTTKYNLQLRVEENHGIPPRLYIATVKCFETIGILGEFRVNSFGRLQRSFDGRCEKVVRATFNVMYSTEGRSAREIVQHAALVTSGFDEQRMDALKLGEQCVDALEQHEPLADMPYGMYTNMPLMPSMELRTPCGLQQLHAHKNDSQHIRFWRPSKDKFIYDWDTFKDYVLDLYLQPPTLYRWNDGTILGALERKVHDLTHDRTRRALGGEAMQHPDSVDRIPWW